MRISLIGIVTGTIFVATLAQGASLFLSDTDTPIVVGSSPLSAFFPPGTTPAQIGLPAGAQYPYFYNVVLPGLSIPAGVGSNPPAGTLVSVGLVSANLYIACTNFVTVEVGAAPQDVSISCAAEGFYDPTTSPPSTTVGTPEGDEDGVTLMPTINGQLFSGTTVYLTGQPQYSAPTIDFPIPMASRTFVSTTGDDSNTSHSCSASANCRTLSAALKVTSLGGEVVILNSGGYGPAVIYQPVVVMADDVDASISVTASNTNGIEINTIGNVTLSGLSLHGEGVGTDGINVIDVQFLRLYNTRIENFTGNGVAFVITTYFGTTGFLAIYGSTINDNSVGLFVFNGQAYVHDSVFDNNKYAGVQVGAEGEDPYSQVVVADSSAHYNGTAFLASGGTLTLFNDRAMFNTTALASTNGGTLYFAACLISNNTTAYNTASGTMAGSSPGSSLITPGQAMIGTLSAPAISQ